MAQVPDPIANSQGKAIMEVIASSSHRTRMCSYGRNCEADIVKIEALEEGTVNVVSMDR